MNLRSSGTNQRQQRKNPRALVALDSSEIDTETEKAQSHNTRPKLRLKNFGLRLRDRYQDQTILISTINTETENLIFYGQEPY